MNSGTDPFDQVIQIATDEGRSQAIAFLVDRFRSEKNFFELFEMLKIQIRHDLGLPIMHGEQHEKLDEKKNRLLEDRLLEACREVGSALVRQGRLQDGWMYLQPIGDRQYLRQLFESVKINEENTDLLIDICLGQGIAARIGLRLGPFRPWNLQRDYGFRFPMRCPAATGTIATGRNAGAPYLR